MPQGHRTGPRGGDFGPSAPMSAELRAQIRAGTRLAALMESGFLRLAPAQDLRSHLNLQRLDDATKRAVWSALKREHPEQAAHLKRVFADPVVQGLVARLDAGVLIPDPRPVEDYA